MNSGDKIHWGHKRKVGCEFNHLYDLENQLPVSCGELLWLLKGIYYFFIFISSVLDQLWILQLIGTCTSKYTKKHKHVHVYRLSGEWK